MMQAVSIAVAEEDILAKDVMVMITIRNSDSITFLIDYNSETKKSLTLKQDDGTVVIYKSYCQVANASNKTIVLMPLSCNENKDKIRM